MDQLQRGGGKGHCVLYAARFVMPVMIPGPRGPVPAGEPKPDAVAEGEGPEAGPGHHPVPAHGRHAGAAAAPSPIDTPEEGGLRVLRGWGGKGRGGGGPFPLSDDRMQILNWGPSKPNVGRRFGGEGGGDTGMRTPLRWMVYLCQKKLCS